MNLLLFQTSRGEIFPVIETIPPPEVIIGEDSNRWQRIKGVTLQTYHRLKEKLNYHENLCSQLRHASELHVYHPSSWDPAEVPERLRLFFKSRYRKHGRWLCADAVLAFLGIFFTPIPGPNFFFYYPAARTLGHYLARRGAKQALGPHQIFFQEEPLIDQVQAHLGNLERVSDVVADLETRYHLKNLEKLLSRLTEK